MDKRAASELVAERFSRMMNATTSPLGVAADPPIVAVATAVCLVAYLGARQMEVSARVEQALLVLVFVPIGIAVLVSLALLGSRGRLVEWLSKQPFPIENMNAILNGLGDGLEVTFQEGVKVPATPELNAKLDTVHQDCFVTESKDGVVTMKIGVVDSKRNPAASNYRRYRRVMEMVEKILVPMHADLPIVTVRVR